MSSQPNSSKIEDLIINIIGGTISNLLPMLILAVIAILGRFLLGTIDIILPLVTAIICVSITTITTRRRVLSHTLHLSKTHAVSLILTTIATYFGLAAIEPWCSYEPIYFIVKGKDGKEYTVKDDRAQIEQNERLAVKLIAKSKLETEETLGEGFICTWGSVDETRIASSSGCFMWFDTSVTPDAPQNHVTVELRHKSCQRREQRTLAIKLGQ